MKSRWSRDMHSKVSKLLIGATWWPYFYQKTNKSNQISLRMVQLKNSDLAFMMNFKNVGSLILSISKWDWYVIQHSNWLCKAFKMIRCLIFNYQVPIYSWFHTNFFCFLKTYLFWELQTKLKMLIFICALEIVVIFWYKSDSVI